MFSLRFVFFWAEEDITVVVVGEFQPETYDEQFSVGGLVDKVSFSGVGVAVHTVLGCPVEVELLEGIELAVVEHASGFSDVLGNNLERVSEVLEVRLVELLGPLEHEAR